MRSGWARFCLWLLFLAVILGTCGFEFFLCAENLFKTSIGEALVWTATGATKRLAVPSPWRQAVDADVASISRSIVAGVVSMFPGMRLMRSFERGPVYLSLLLRGFEGIVRARYPQDEAWRKDVSRRIGRFFSTWKLLGQPDNVVASVNIRLTDERQEISPATSGFAVPEVFRGLRLDWNEQRIESALSFFDSVKVVASSSPQKDDETLTTFSGATDGEEFQKPDPLDELRAEIARLIALGTAKDPTQGSRMGKP